MLRILRDAVPVDFPLPTIGIMSEVEPLLAPISEDRPTGPNLRNEIEDLTFTSLGEMTTSVGGAMAETEDDVVEANWSGVVGLCTAALTEKTKDLELITNLAEAWARTEGVTAIPKGIELMLRSVQNFWAEIHPGYDDDDDEIILPIRGRWLNWLDAPTGFIQAIKQSPIVSAQGGGEYTWRDHENSDLLEDVTASAERRQELVQAGVISDAQWQAALGTISSESLGEIVEALTEAYSLTESLRTYCESPFADDEDVDPPAFYKLLDTLEEMRDYFRELLGGGEDADSDDGEGEQQSSSGGVAAAGGGGRSGPLATRADALRQLQEVGDYFRRSEPHSPISYLIARSVKWGTMPLDQLLKDVVRNDEVIEHVWETLGLDASSDDEGGGYDDD
jgi:type VI secretion system protein ImpA